MSFLEAVGNLERASADFLQMVEFRNGFERVYSWCVDVLYMGKQRMHLMVNKSLQRDAGFALIYEFACSARLLIQSEPCILIFSRPFLV